MAIANMLGQTATGVEINRPFMMKRAVNDNVTKESSDLMKTGMADLVSTFSKISETLKDINEFSRKVLDGFRKTVLSITNLERDIRFRFTYLQKDLDASNKDLLSAIKSLSFSTGVGAGLDEAGPEFVNQPGKVTDFTLGGGIPPLPDIRRPPRPGQGPGQGPARPGPARTTPRPGTTPSDIFADLPKQRARRGTGAERGAPARPGAPARVRPPSTPALDIRIPGASVSMEYTPRPGAGVSGANVPGLSTQVPARLGGAQGPYTATLPTTPGGQPTKAPASTQPPPTTETGQPAKAAPRGKLSVALKGLGPAALVLSPIVAAIEAKTELETFAETGNKENLKNVYGIIGKEAAATTGAIGGAWIGALAGGPAAPLTGLMGGIWGAIEAGKQGEIVGRAAYNVKHENMNFWDALKLETLRYAAREKEQELAAKIAEMQRRADEIITRPDGKAVYQSRSTQQNRATSYEGHQEIINKLTAETATAKQAVMELERELERARQAAVTNTSPAGAPEGSPQVSAPPPGSAPAGPSRPGAAGAPVGGGRNAGMGGPDLEVMSRNVQQSAFSSMSLAPVEMQPQTEVIDDGGGGTEGIAGHPNFVLDASNAFVMDFQKQLFNYMGNVPTRAA